MEEMSWQLFQELCVKSYIRFESKYDKTKKWLLYLDDDDTNKVFFSNYGSDDKLSVCYVGNVFARDGETMVESIRYILDSNIYLEYS